jgi:transcriptional pleiotropic regulator of transition state genes
MKATGIVRVMDSMGRIVIPVELRRMLDVGEGDALEVFSEDNTIVLRKYLPSCIFCGNSREVTTFKGHNICPACAEELKRRMD